MNWAIKLSRVYAPLDGEVAIYGVVVYTDAHPHIKKVLRDDDYWLALDELSGSRWKIFATRAEQGKRRPASPVPGRFAEMVEVWQEPAANKDLLEGFQLNSTSGLPALVLFTQNEQREVFRAVVELDESSEQGAYGSMRSIIARVTDVINSIDASRLEDDKYIFEAINRAVKKHKGLQRLTKGVEVWQWLRSVSPV